MEEKYHGLLASSKSILKSDLNLQCKKAEIYGLNRNTIQCKFWIDFQMFLHIRLDIFIEKCLHSLPGLLQKSTYGKLGYLYAKKNDCWCLNLNSKAQNQHLPMSFTLKDSKHPLYPCLEYNGHGAFFISSYPPIYNR